ncbi:hypothetical protein E2C01_066137 [Portunus trituberculatus]|uniref:Uncharacterized protein n=1 Tax=Portunus trituberculatus TaxID=210409 RepID=A0A5B7HRH8_PORTR|nr:hypothetical protein [Portunus trituberculatus]
MQNPNHVLQVAFVLKSVSGRRTKETLAYFLGGEPVTKIVFTGQTRRSAYIPLGSGVLFVLIGLISSSFDSIAIKNHLPQGSVRSTFGRRYEKVLVCPGLPYTPGKGAAILLRESTPGSILTRDGGSRAGDATTVTTTTTTTTAAAGHPSLHALTLRKNYITDTREENALYCKIK